ncbi:hypothetical protein HanXRQr2_Chr11g0484721 [Helianthus annuus]|uniref:Uncharacterized protein n=1 Tax=Helianthus annuus TaxID=4232 RepID=A0A9K3HNQ4_HELAN|nr:hypothetical protein HanXRQr2_Chr11g0484721 [Helianthus annuus]
MNHRKKKKKTKSAPTISTLKSKVNQKQDLETLERSNGCLGNSTEANNTNQLINFKRGDRVFVYVMSEI